MSIRTRLMITTSAIVLVVVGVLSIGIYSTFSRQLVRQVDKSLDDRVVMIADSLRRESQRPNIGRQRNPLNEALLPTRFDTVTQVVSTAGTVVLALGEVELPVTDKTLQIANDPDGNVFRSTVTIDGDKYRMLTVPLTGGGALQLAKDINDLQRAQNAVRGWQFALGPIGIMFAGLAGWWVARRTARPIQQLADAAEDIARTQNLSTKLDIHGDHEIEQLANSFNAMLARLDDSFQRLSAFSADIAHELRTPLSNLLTHTQVTLTRPRPIEDYREALHSNLEELQWMAQLVNDMLYLAKADHGLLTPKCEALELAEETDMLLEFYGPLAEDANVSLSREGHAGFIGDRSMLRRALSNLLDNALRFTPPGGSVQVRISDSLQGLNLSIENSGEGIAREVLPRLFDRFYRVDPARREGSSEHAGLGLAITQSIIRAHGGRIRCESEAGWTRFVIELPSKR